MLTEREAQLAFISEASDYDSPRKQYEKTLLHQYQSSQDDKVMTPKARKSSEFFTLNDELIQNTAEKENPTFKKSSQFFNLKEPLLLDDAGQEISD